MGAIKWVESSGRLRKASPQMGTITVRMVATDRFVTITESMEYLTHWNSSHTTISRRTYEMEFFSSYCPFKSLYLPNKHTKTSSIV